MVFGFSNWFSVGIGLVFVGKFSESDITTRRLRYGTVRYGMVWYGTVRYDMVRHGTARYSTARYGTARHGAVRCGAARYGTVRVRYDTLYNSLEDTIDKG